MIRGQMGGDGLEKRGHSGDSKRERDWEGKEALLKSLATQGGVIQASSHL